MNGISRIYNRKKNDATKVYQRNEDWRSIVDAFRKGTVEFTISLSRIQTAFIELGIEQ